MSAHLNRGLPGCREVFHFYTPGRCAVPFMFVGEKMRRRWTSEESLDLLRLVIVRPDDAHHAELGQEGHRVVTKRLCIRTLYIRTSSKIFKLFLIRVLVGLFGYMLCSSGEEGGCEWSVGCASPIHHESRPSPSNLHQHP